MHFVGRKDALNMMLVNTIVLVSVGLIILTLNKRRRRTGVHRRTFTILDRIPAQIKNMSYLCEVSDADCRDQLRMDRATFHKLCFILQSVCGLKSSRRVCVSEKVAMFLSILSHHTKNRCVKFAFKRSGETVSKHFHAVLNSVLRLHAVFLVRPQPITEDNTDPRWHQFQGCLGALDGTHIDVHVPISDKGRYRNRKGQITVNVLCVCDIHMRFVYILSGWEGSAADSRVLRNALNKENGLKVPKDNYYLCDNGYPNCEGFLTPYKGVRYHLNEWTSRRPQTQQEYFNMKHTRARNVIERTFGLLKMRWGILRSPSWYPIKTVNKIITACCLLHNYIRHEMLVDPLELGLDDYLANQLTDDSLNDSEFVDSLDTTTQWTAKRDEMALNMFNEWRNATAN